MISSLKFLLQAPNLYLPVAESSTLKQRFGNLLYAFHSRNGEEMYIVVAVLEQVFHLGGCPFDAENFGIFIRLAL